MANNLPSPLTHDQVQALKTKILGLAEDFAAENNLDRERVRLEFGFICGHLAALAGVQVTSYLEWVDGKREVRDHVNNEPDGEHLMEIRGRRGVL